MSGASRFSEVKALMRSVRLYHGPQAPRREMDALYARFLKAGDLALDIGSHVGDRVLSFRRLGARVLALEPQPGPARIVELLTLRDPDVTLLRMAAGPREGRLTLHVNSANPTVSTASADFLKAAEGAGGWEGQVWDRAIDVPVTTLDALIAQHGVPAFVKIDVEGFEDQVLAGLSQPVRALSFEFTTIERSVARACINRLERLGPYRFNAALGESQSLAFEAPISGAAMANWIDALPHDANSGDVYAMLG